MKWPFVRRSKYDNLQNQVNCLHKIHGEYAQLNHDNLHEINSLNQELANELNSHRETKDHNKRLFAKNETLKKELEETNRKYEYKLNFEQECTEKIGIELEETKDALKIAIDDLKNAALCIGEQKTQLEIWKKRSNFYSNNCTEAKESISRVTGYLKTIAKKL